MPVAETFVVLPIVVGGGKCRRYNAMVWAFCKVKVMEKPGTDNRLVERSNVACLPCKGKMVSAYSLA